MSFPSRSSKKPADLRSVFDYATWLLARRSYSVAELLAKFQNRFLSNQTVFSAAIARLQDLGFQSDHRFVEDFVRSHSGWGVMRLRLELRKRGISPELIEVCLPSESDELARCQAALQTRLRGAPLPADFLDRERLTAFLARRGFDLDIIQKACLSYDSGGSAAC